MYNIEERRYTLWLSTINGIGSTRGNMLIDFFGSAKNVYEQDSFSLHKVPFLNTKLIENIIKYDFTNLEKLEDTLEKHNIKYVTLFEDDYPCYLKEIAHPPIVLYYKGELIDFTQNLPIAIVGSRHCSYYGKEMAMKVSKELALNNAIVISGLAKGIDALSHKGALEVGAKTVAVVGNGLDICYPAENKKLFHDITQNGCVISEYPPGMQPLKQNFPLRNRIIAGISRGILVVEAKRRSGTSITVNYGADEGRDIFCIPGNATSALSDGTNQLIREGAYLVTCGEEILEEYNELDKKYKSIADEKPLEKLTTEEKLLYLEIKNNQGVYIDELMANEKFADSSLMYLIMTLEIKGYIIKQSGNKYYTK